MDLNNTVQLFSLQIISQTGAWSISVDTFKKNYKQIISRIFVGFKTAVCADYAAVKLQITKQTRDSVVSVTWPAVKSGVVLFSQSGQRPVSPSQSSDWWFVPKFETPTKCNIELNEQKFRKKQKKKKNMMMLTLLHVFPINYALANMFDTNISSCS